MGRNQHSKEPRRTHVRIVRLTDDENARAIALAARLTASTGRKVYVADVLRANLSCQPNVPDGMSAYPCDGNGLFRWTQNGVPTSVPCPGCERCKHAHV